MKNKRGIQGGPDPQRQSIMLAVSLMASFCVGLFAQSAWAGQTTTYAFLAGQSAITQTGGIAGIHRTYTITGTFQLTVDFEAGTATFDRVDANAVDDSPDRHTLDPNEVFDMTELAGTIIDGTTIRFEGTADDGSSVLITLTFTDDTVALKGQTTPPPNSADFFVFTLDAIAQRKYSGGTGEPNDPYQIATAEDLMLLGETPADYDKHFILTADIDLDPNLPELKVFDRAVIAPDVDDDSWLFEGTAFTGVFDGNGHTISHLTITGDSYLGLFGQLGRGASISNLGLEALDVYGIGEDVGGLAGYNEGSIVASYSSGSVRGTWSVGGLVGCNGGSITDSYSDGSVRATHRYAGGLVGVNDSGGIVTRCHSTGVVIGKDFVGGLVGGNWDSVTQCYSTGAVNGTGRYVGGLIGSNAFGNVIHCYSISSVRGKSVVGGLVGYNGEHVTHCYSAGAVSGTGSVGGLVGSGSASACFWDVQTSGQATSAAGTGLTTAQMYDIRIYQKAGWDFVGETQDGLHDVWQMAEGGGYPVLAILNGSALPQLQGSGTREDPYLISDAAELGAMINHSPHDHYRLVASIDLSGIRWGLAVIPLFGGVFDGNGHTISHLTIHGVEYLGLFGQLGYAAEIKDLRVVDVNIVGSAKYVGSLVGASTWGSWRDVALTNCYSTGTITGTSSVGGLVGFSSDRVTASYSSSSALVRGENSVGGLVGNNGFACTVIRCYSTGVVNGGSSVGGLVGSNGTVTDCFSTAAVSGDSYVGGLVGLNVAGTVTYCYSAGLVSGNEGVGGLVGDDLDRRLQRPVHTGIVTASFWDTQTSGQATSAGGTGKTTDEMQAAKTFLDAGWDFVGETANGTDDIWWIDEGKDYPRLWWESK